MENSCFVLSKVVKFIKDKLKLSQYGATFWAGIVAGLLAHGFALTNKLVCLSDVEHFFEKGATITSGRWFLPVLSVIFPDFSMPWIYGFLTIVLYTVSACIIVKIFEINNPVLKGLVGALTVTFPCVTATIGHMFTSIAYGVTFLLAAVGFFLIKDKFSYKSIIGVVCLTLSMGIYQAYISVVACFAIIYLAEKLFDGKEKTKSIINIAIRILVSIAISSALYFIIMKLSLAFVNGELSSYANSALKGSEPLKSTIVCMFLFYIRTFFEGSYGLIPTTFSKILHISCLAFVAVFVIIWLFKKEKLINKFLMLVLIGFYPAAVNLLFVISSTYSCHILTMYSYATLYLVVIIIIERLFTDCKSKLIFVLKEISSVVLVCIVISNVYVANEAYLDYKLRYENLYSYYTQVITQVKMQPEFTADTKIAIIGTTDDIPEFYSKFGNVNGMRGINEFTPNVFNRDLFIEYYIGIDADFASKEEKRKLCQTDEFKKMPTYPDYGSIKCIDNCIVVKLGELN